ncbi:MAG: cytochrome [Bdellovibrionales bacterium]
MYLQGNLQLVFDALFTIGAIDPILKMDWSEVTRQMEEQPLRLHRACETLNDCRDDFSRMVETLKRMDSTTIHFVALEVAREFCEFQDRKSLH